VLGWSITQIGVFGILAAATGAVGAWLGGKVDKAMGPRPVIIFCAVTLIVVCVVIVSTSRTSFLFLELPDTSPIPDIVFYICGAIIGAAGGSLQAASRTMMVHQAQPGRMTEAFGLYALTGKATSFIAPLSIGVVTELTDSQRLGVTPLIVLFAIGLVLLYWVKTEHTGNPDAQIPIDPDRAAPGV
jgi:MFS transporter, UMF1 family